MKMLFDFVCRDGHRSEALVDKETFEILCRTCDEPARKAISVPKFKLEGWSGAFPSSADRWTREHEEAGRKGRERRKEEDFYTPADPHSLI